MTLFKQLLGILLIIGLAAACKQPETIVVDEDPQAASSGDTTAAAQAQTRFQQLNVGEYLPIRTLDPLFSENAAAMRAVQLIYEGLVRFNAQGEVVPGLAFNWSVGKDSLKYEFYLRPEIYYHDSQVFSTGTGRRVMPDDVEFVFKRMASLNVPPQAARMFMNIEGFEPYFQEQRHIYNPQNRQIEDITGIQTPNDSTIVFQLKEADPDFPQKLATPLAAIYPREAVTGNSSITPVGAGPFAFTQVTSDSTLVLSRFQEYYAADEISLNRIDIQVNSSETLMGKAMNNGDLHLIPQLGPKLMVNLINENGQLKEEYQDQYQLTHPGGSISYALRYNPEADLSLSAARALTADPSTDTTSYFTQFPANLVKVDTTGNAPSVAEELPTGQQEFYTTYSEDPYIQTFLGNLSTQFSNQGLSLQMLNIRAPTTRTPFLFTNDFPLIPNRQWHDFPKLFGFTVDQVTLQQQNIEGLSFNRYPWWFDVRGVTVPEASKL